MYVFFVLEVLLIWNARILFFVLFVGFFYQK